MIKEIWITILYWLVSHWDSPLTMSLWIAFCFAVIYAIPGVITLILLTVLDTIDTAR